MFYNGREVLSDHFQLILFWVPESSFCKKKRENGIKWEFFPQGGGGHPFPLLLTIIPPRFFLFWKSKNVPKVLKCKINHKCLSNMGFSNWKFQHFSVFFYWERPLSGFVFIVIICEGGTDDPSTAVADQLPFWKRIMVSRHNLEHHNFYYCHGCIRRGLGGWVYCGGLN